MKSMQFTSFHLFLKVPKALGLSIGALVLHKEQKIKTMIVPEKEVFHASTTSDKTNITA